MLGDATTSAQLTPTDRAQGAAIAWAALVAIAQRAPSYVTNALVSLLQSTYGRYRPTLQARNPQANYPAIAVDGAYGPQTAFAATVLIAQVAETGSLLTSIGYTGVFPSKVNSTALVQANIAAASAMVDKLSDRTGVIEAIGFPDLGRSMVEAAKRGRNASEATTNALQLVTSSVQSLSPTSGTTAATVTSTRSTSEGFVQTMTAQTQVPSAVVPVVPVSSTPGQTTTTPAGAPLAPVREVQGEPMTITGRRWAWVSNPKIIVPVGLLVLFASVYAVKHWKKRRG